MEPKNLGPDVGHPYQTPKEADKPREGEQVARPGRSPLTDKLLAPGEELMGALDYGDMEEDNPGVPDPEVTQALTNIPKADVDMEMQESHAPRVSNWRLPEPGMTSTWSVLTLPNRGWHPRLR